MIPFWKGRSMLLGFEISPEQLKEKLEAHEDILVLDVRDLGEYSVAHIDGARLIPLAALPGRFESLAEWRSKPIVVYCHQGDRSMDAMVLLQDAGFSSLQMLDGGIDAWCERIEPHKPRYRGPEDPDASC